MYIGGVEKSDFYGTGKDGELVAISSSSQLLSEQAQIPGTLHRH
jgi:hypothetical protein